MEQREKENIKMSDKTLTKALTKNTQYNGYYFTSFLI